MSTTQRRLLRVELHTLWHAGSGRGDGPGADALVVCGPKGAPYLPGRTLKGLLRDAYSWASRLGHTGERPATHVLFGGVDPSARAAGVDDVARYDTQLARVRVSDARLGGESAQAHASWQAWLGEDPARAMALKQIVNATALDEQGTVKAQTLRSVEFAVPLVLYAELEGDPESLDAIAWIAPLVRELGARRHRGFGRCTLQVCDVVEGV